MPRQCRTVQLVARIRGELKTLCETCERCIANRPTQRFESMNPTTGTLLSRPWEKVGADLCVHNNKDYLMLIDYYGRLEIKHLSSITSRAVIDRSRQVFAMHGILDKFHSDNRAQFDRMSSDTLQTDKDSNSQQAAHISPKLMEKQKARSSGLNAYY